MYTVFLSWYDTVSPAPSDGMALVPLASYKIVSRPLGFPCPEEHASSETRHYHLANLPNTSLGLERSKVTQSLG